MKKQIFAFLVINAIFLIIGFGVKQKNPEELFLSDHNLKILQDYKKQFGNDDVTFASGISSESFSSLEKKVFDAGGDIVSIDRFLPNHAVFTLPVDLDDELKFKFFQNISTIDSNISFAGGNFTNAHLAGMSVRIQEFIFPIVFVIMFLSLCLIFRNLMTTIYLFITSFIGVSVGLAVVKLFFSYSTFLTSLTPLVCFILTLANQMHVIFGIHTFETKKKFLEHKLQPILIMMGTTLIGFASLMYSDLVSIRQFGIATTVTLSITWALNLIFLSSFKLYFKIPQGNFSTKIKSPPPKPFLALLICLSILGAGIYSLKLMPTLVEAIFFFPKDHPVRMGHKEIEKQLGGTPQLEIIISKADQSEMNFNDLIQIEKYELFLKSTNIPYKILSINELTKQANKIYSGNNTLPDNMNAYFLLRGQIPEMLRHSMASDTSYKLSLLSPPLSTEARIKNVAEIKSLLKNLPTGFHGEISGLNYLLLDSQNDLVKTLLNSLIGSFLLIALIFSIFSRNLKEIFLFSIISLSSIFGGLFLMNLFGFSLNVSSVMVLSISIGLIDDSTIHLLYAQKHQESEDNIYRSCVLPMIFSNLILFICFSLLGLEDFIPIKEFAWGLVLMLTTGLFLDLFVLPMFRKR